MSQIYLKQGIRCQEHPHRETDRRCDRCGLPFCDACLSPTARKADGTRDWFCARCTRLAAVGAARESEARTWRGRLSRHTATARALVVALAGAALLSGGAYVAVRLIPHSGAAAPPLTMEANCGELTRMRSIGAIGTQSPDDAVNLLAYPHRAAVRLAAPADAPAPNVPSVPSVGLPVAPVAPVAPDAPAAGTSNGPTALEALVDECDTGWRQPGATTLPVVLILDSQRNGSYVQRFALWQDPKAPHASWVRDFELLASTSADGDDFVPVQLDRPGQLRETTEAQWFEIMRPGPGALAQSFPDVVEMRRLMVRILTTYGSTRPRSRVEALSLGEIAAYGPDVEIVVGHPSVNGDEDQSRFVFVPSEIRALAMQPKFVLFMNRTRTAAMHQIVSIGQQQNFSVTLGPGEARSAQFIAGRPGRYEFYCKVINHDRLGLMGTIVVR